MNPELDENPMHELVARARSRVSELLARGSSLREALSQLTSAVEQFAGGRTVASILVLDREGLLRNGASPNLPADYLDRIDRLRPHPGLGTCASAAATGEITITPSFQEDSKWAELRHLPLSIGFRSAWSMPIKSSEGSVLGTFGTYFRETRQPTGPERRLVAELAPLAAQVIETCARGR
ncbi:GAF domain-containing protein [Ramlibacter henchirensis]|uniref:GAF domain-containing protein n=2 Tax=Ramlibacter henchirensis TaxID=204072 RepID=A0A4Z0BVF7_9BURK|nr:GAF domain-containing protein [Ramlibacter henchirensis]